jgi:putative aldouronate transport system substrate-binding protein
MKKNFLKRFLSTGLAIALVASSLAGCSKAGNQAEKPNTGETGKNNVTEAPASDKPDTWIADRTITIQAYVDDIGYSLPAELNNTAVMKELTKRTGIKLNIQYTPGDKDINVMASQLASGTIPDAIVCYLDNSTRPEFPILLKAAREGMFADVSGFLKDTKVYSRYQEEGYLPNDTYKNITFRDEFGGAAYILQLSIDSEDRSMVYNAQDAYVGGMYIQKSIVDALGIDPKEVRTMDQFYDLLVKIKEGGFKDDNGNPVYPLGPKFWGGSADSLNWVTRGYNWGVSDNYNTMEDGTILHEAETDYVYKKINFLRKLLAEELMNPEFFTMDSTRAEEVSRTHNSAIIADVHNYQDIVFSSEDWVPLGLLNDFAGNNATITPGKTGYGAMAISADAQNPEEILKFFDYLSTPEGQLLCQYGIEGENYTLVDGKPQLTEDTAQKLNEGDKDYLVNTVGASYGNAACVFFGYALTNLDNVGNFGESRPGAGSNSNFTRSIQIAKDYERGIKLVPGLRATAYLSVDSLAEVKANLALLNYNEMLVQAVYAGSDAEVTQIVESFREQLKAAGMDTFIEYITKVYTEDKTSINFYTK